MTKLIKLFACVALLGFFGIIACMVMAMINGHAGHATEVYGTQLMVAVWMMILGSGGFMTTVTLHQRPRNKINWG